jgi:hypothetical protein
VTLGSIRRLTACVVAAACLLGIFYLWTNGGMSHPELMLIPMAPFVLLAAVACSRFEIVARGALALIILFGVWLVARVLYGHYRADGDEWLLLSLVLIGAWQIVIAFGSLLAAVIVGQCLLRRK